MKQRPLSYVRIALLAACFGWCMTGPVQAQFFGGGIGGTGGRSTGGRTGSGTTQYPNNTEVGNATISVDQDGRRIVVVTDDQTNENIKEVINNLDRPKPQVLIKVVFLEVTHNDNLDVGVEGNYTKNLGHSLFSGLLTTNFGVVSNNVVPTSVNKSIGNSTVASAVNAFGGTSTSPIPPGAGLYQILGQDYQVTLRAIAQAGKAEILSRPSILARNGQPATINVGQQVPLITGTRFDTTGNQINTVTYQSVGIILKVTPFITSDGMVEMIVQPETSELADKSQWVPISSGTGGIITSPVINSRSADTVVVVPDSQTVIIGGLMERQKTDSVSKIPILGDIPLLGFAFRHKQKSDVKTELVIFLTPHVVQAPSQLAGLSRSEQEKAPVRPQAFTEKELNQFLEGLPVKEPDKKSKGKK